MRAIKFNNGQVFGDGNKVFIVAEIGLCHNGDLDRAKQLIKESVEAGVHAVKFQKRDVDNLAIREVLDAPDNRFPSFGKTYREVRKFIEFDVSAYKKLMEYADKLGVAFFVSVFDIQSAKEMAELNIPVFKVASHCMSNKPLIRYLSQLKIPVLLSTGMSYIEEIDETVKMLVDAEVPLGIYHCVSEYPHSFQTSNLTFIQTLKNRYGLPVGYSSHEKENYTAILAVAAGACSIEKHVTLSNEDEGFDHKMALTMPMLKNLVDEVKKAEIAMGNGEKTVSLKEMETREKYHYSVVSCKNIKTGEKITADMLTTKNPGTGIHAKEIDTLIGCTACIDIKEDTLLDLSMVS
jgi:N-acetylneuraminate synthase/N,N'-diacetyllegionaminate synthase